MMDSSNDDCYFYYYSTCAKGNECPYRHCELALGTETVCSLWREGLCQRKNCKFRHMESRIKRTTIPCYWENQPGGCRKPHCVFLHKKAHGTAPKDKTLIFSNVSISPAKSPPIHTTADVALLTEVVTSPSVPVEPVVVRLNDGEESDTESMTSTPIKVQPNSVREDDVSKRNLFKNSDGDDFGIKTLEQLRMDKIHRESEHFYKTDYDSPSLEETHRNFEVLDSVYEPDSYINDESSSLNSVAVMDEGGQSGDLRSLLKRKQTFTSNPEESRKRVISLKRFCTSDVENEPGSITITLSKKPPQEDNSSDAMDFQIKTLAEIKKEKKIPDIKNKIILQMKAIRVAECKSLVENEKETSVQHVQTSKEETLIVENKKPLQVLSPKSRAKRPSQEIYKVKPSISNGSSRVKIDSFNSKLEPKRAKIYFEEPQIANTKISSTKVEDKPTDINSASVAMTRRIQVQKPAVKAHEDSSREKPVIKSLIAQKNNLSGIASFLRRQPVQQMVDTQRELQSNVTLPTKLEIDTECHINSVDNKSHSELLITKLSATEEEENVNNLIEKSGLCQNDSLNRSKSLCDEEEFEKLLLEDEADITLDPIDDSTENAEDIFLELEEMLKS